MDKSPASSVVDSRPWENYWRFAASSGAVFIARSDTGRIVGVNREAASLLETSVDKIIGRDQSELHPPDQAARYRKLFQQAQDIAAGGKATLHKLGTSPIFVVTETGKRIPVTITAAFAELGGAEFFVGVFRPLPTFDKNEGASGVNQETAGDAIQITSEMLEKTGRRIRGLSTAIIRLSKRLSTSLTGEPAEQAKNVHDAAQDLLKAVNSILDLIALETDLHGLTRERASLDQAVRWSVELWDSEAEERGIELNMDLPDSPIQGQWNQGALNQIVQELLENALKFTPEGGQVHLRIRTAGKEAVLEVQDTGIGMSPDEVSGLFDAFRQGRPPVFETCSGIGLGLPIVKELTELLGGTVEVETENRKGSHFYVRLPLQGDVQD